MNIRPLTQFREMIAAALRSQTNIGKSFQSFFIETMELFLTHTGRLNFTQMARCGCSFESRFRQNFKKAFDWFSFNRTFLEPARVQCDVHLDVYVRTGRLESGVSYAYTSDVGRCIVHCRRGRARAWYWGEPCINSHVFI